MNGLRWNPNGYNGAGFNIVFNSVQTYATGQLQVVVRATIDAGAPLQNLPAPYSDKTKDCPFYKLTATGMKAEGSLPMGPFAIHSPLRPVCKYFENQLGEVTWGDITVNTPVAANFSVSGWTQFDNSLVFPSGFTPIQFTGRSSTFGSIYNALVLNVTTPYVPVFITMPQIKYPNDTGIRTDTDISILSYNPKNGEMYHISPSSWDPSGTALPYLVMQVNLPQTGVFIFGRIDRSTSISLPIDTNNYVDFLPAWGEQDFYVLNDALTIRVRSEEQLKMAVMKPGASYPNPDGHKIMYMAYIFAEGQPLGPKDKLTMSLIKDTYPQTDAIWA